MFDFSKRLLKLRKSRGLSQIELAHKIRISSSTLGNYENDMGIPSLSVAESLADVLNVSLDYLACGGTTVQEQRGGKPLKIQDFLLYEFFHATFLKGQPT